MTTRRLRQVVDLYTTGTVEVLKDGTPIWIQPLNPFEQDTARSEAQVAKARMSMAIREFGSDEQVKIRNYFFEDGLDGARERLVDAKVNVATIKVFDALRNDPEWTERLTILERGDEDTATPLEPNEQEVMLKITNEYAAELGRRLAQEREWQVTEYADASEEVLWEAYLAWYVERRANEVMTTEFRHHQVLYGVRWCDGERTDNGWDHSKCEGHPNPMFATKADLRAAPGDLLDLLYTLSDQVDMTAREAKNSPRQGSSSDSSPLPSEVEVSTASTPDEIPVAPPGSSPSPSVTPLPSLAGTS